MNLIEMVENKVFKKTGETKKITIPGQNNNLYDVYDIPLEYLYYNDQNGRINTSYRKYLAENDRLIPEAGNSKYNQIFEKFIYESNKGLLKQRFNQLRIRDSRNLVLYYQMDVLLMEIDVLLH